MLELVFGYESFPDYKLEDRMAKRGARAEEFEGSNVTVNACHPGDVNSRLSNDLGFGGHETAKQAARTPVWLATDAVGRRETGRYFEHMQVVRCRFGEDSRSVKELFGLCQAY